MNPAPPVTNIRFPTVRYRFILYGKNTEKDLIEQRNIFFFRGIFVFTRFGRVSQPKIAEI